jgi:hypothetical protein
MPPSCTRYARTWEDSHRARTVITFRTLFLGETTPAAARKNFPLGKLPRAPARQKGEVCRHDHDRSPPHQKIRRRLGSVRSARRATRLHRPANPGIRPLLRPRPLRRPGRRDPPLRQHRSRDRGNDHDGRSPAPLIRRKARSARPGNPSKRGLSRSLKIQGSIPKSPTRWRRREENDEGRQHAQPRVECGAAQVSIKVSANCHAWCLDLTRHKISDRWRGQQLPSQLRRRRRERSHANCRALVCIATRKQSRSARRTRSHLGHCGRHARLCSTEPCLVPDSETETRPVTQPRRRRESLGFQALPCRMSLRLGRAKRLSMRERDR